MRHELLNLSYQELVALYMTIGAMAEGGLNDKNEPLHSGLEKLYLHLGTHLPPGQKNGLDEKLQEMIAVMKSSTTSRNLLQMATDTMIEEYREKRNPF